jgi:GntR family negative regulator for fad regulon and positive regulator of fabA
MTTYQKPSKISKTWQPIPKAAETIENRLIEAILDGTFSINSHLPGERELAESLGVTRPTLREALQRLARDGWVEIHQGKPTRVRDYWKEGRLGVLNSLSERPNKLPDNFIPNLLTVRLAMAPMYTGLAVSNAPKQVAQLLDGRFDLNQSPDHFTQFDWNLQHTLTLLSDNPVFIMILNGFEALYLNLAPFYFAIPGARQRSLDYYENLADAAEKEDVFSARTLTEEIMRDSLNFWQQTKFL